jgi:phosphate acetyltransferase
MLSYSTKGSGKGEPWTSPAAPPRRPRPLSPSLKHRRRDAVRRRRFSGRRPAEVPRLSGRRQANTFIFPMIEAGNIGYKIAQRLGGFAAYGPILQGLNAPINDLSRGCNAEEVYQMSIITAALK